jgi:hypothetical protein
VNTDAKPPKKTMGRRPRTTPRTFTPLAQETRTHITTEEAAHHMNLSPQTLRGWSCFENGPIRPVRIPGVLALQWPVSEIRRVLGIVPAQH